MPMVDLQHCRTADPKSGRLLTVKDTPTIPLVRQQCVNQEVSNLKGAYVKKVFYIFGTFTLLLIKLSLLNIAA